MKATAFERAAGVAAILAGCVGLLYSISFVLLRNALLSGLFLMLGGLLSAAALVALFNRLGEVDSAFALLGLMLGGVSSIGAAIHGSYDLANVINPPAGVPAGLSALPNQIDPRGFLTFGVAGLTLFLAAYLMGRSRRFSRGYVALSYLLAALLTIVYLGRLIVLSPSSPLVLMPAAITGFIVNPLWYIRLGLDLRRPHTEQPALAAAQA